MRRATSVPEQAGNGGHPRSDTGNVNGLRSGTHRLTPCLKRPSKQRGRRSLRKVVGSFCYSSAQGQTRRRGIISAPIRLAVCDMAVAAWVAIIRTSLTAD